jgi:hypothetical protein
MCHHTSIFKNMHGKKRRAAVFCPLSGGIVHVLFCINIRHYENISTFCGKFSRSEGIFGADGKTPAYKAGGSFAIEKRRAAMPAKAP